MEDIEREKLFAVAKAAKETLLMLESRGMPDRFLSLLERLERAKQLRRHKPCGEATNRVAGGGAA